MKILFLSDIHANFEALTALTPYFAQADKILCLGDIIGYYCQVNEVIELLQKLNAQCILGNHDAFLFKGCPATASAEVKFGIDYANAVITAENREWLGKLPLSWAGFIADLSVLLVHGSPWDPLGDYLYANNPQLCALDEFKYDVIAFGQTHRCLLRTEQKPYLINPGSVGQSRDQRALACALMLDTQGMQFKPMACAYDSTKAIKLLQENMPENKALRYLLPHEENNTVL